MAGEFGEGGWERRTKKERVLTFEGSGMGGRFEESCLYEVELQEQMSGWRGAMAGLAAESSIYFEQRVASIFRKPGSLFYYDCSRPAGCTRQAASFPESR